MQISDGMNYAPKGKPSPVVKPGEFLFSAAWTTGISTAWWAP